MMVPLRLLKGICTLCGGVLIHLTLGTLYTFGNMSPYITSYLRFHTSSTDLNYSDSMWIYTAAVMGHGSFMLLGGVSHKKFGSRLTCSIGSFLFSFGVFMTYFAIRKSFVGVIITYGLLFGFGVGIAYSIPMSCAMKWFPQRKGLVNGVIVSGFGAGAVVFDQVQTSYINPHNLETNVTVGPNDDKFFNQAVLLNRVPDMFLLLGGVYTAMQIIGIALLLKPREETREEVSSSTSLIQNSNACSNSLEIEDRKPRDVIMTKQFWMLWLMFLVNAQAVTFTATTYKNYGETFISDDHFLALVGSFAAVFNGVGRIFWGYLADRFTFRLTMIIQCSVMASLFLTFPLTGKAGSSIMFLICVCLMFGTFSGNFALFPTVIAKYYGQKFFTLNYGMLFTSQIISAAISAVLAQNLSDYLGWFGLFDLVAGFAILGLILTFSLNVKKPNGEYI